MTRSTGTRDEMAVRRRLGPTAFLAMVLSILGVTARTAAEPLPTASEYAVKAAFIYNFAKFVEWPAEGRAALASSVKICLLGADPFAGTLDQTVAGKTIGARNVAVAHVDSVSGAADCSVVFVSGSEIPRLSSVLAAFRSLPVLTVGDTDGFAKAGGVIGMYMENNKVRFEINVDAADEAHLKISSRLLSLARVVHEQPRVRR